jgi:hypothetical protein
MSNITEYIAYKKQVDWVTVLIESDFPREYYVTFAAQVTFILAMLLPFWFVDKFVTFLCDNILPQESRDFIVNSYLPELS